jgi:hypothetical protein
MEVPQTGIMTLREQATNFYLGFFIYFGGSTSFRTYSVLTLLFLLCFLLFYWRRGIGLRYR